MYFAQKAPVLTMVPATTEKMVVILKKLCYTFIKRRAKAMNRIKQLRKARGLRQADVARETCIDQKTLSNYETGRTNPDSYAIVQLANFFDVTADYLLGLSDYNLNNVDALLVEIKETQAKLQTIEKILEAEKNQDK